MAGLLDVNELMSPGMGASQYAANPNFTASLAAPQISATPRAGWGNITPQQAPQQGTGGPDLAQPSLGGGFTHDDVQKALGMLYGQLGGGVDWSKEIASTQGLLGQAAGGGPAAGATPGQPGQHPSDGAQTLVDAYRGFQQFHDTDQQIKQAKALFDNPNGYWSGGEGSGGNGGGQR